MERTWWCRSAVLAALVLSTAGCGNRVIDEATGTGSRVAAASAEAEPGLAAVGAQPAAALASEATAAPAPAPGTATGSKVSTPAAQTIKPGPSTAATSSAMPVPSAAQPASGAGPAPASGGAAAAAPGPESAKPVPAAGQPIVIASVGQLSGIVGQAIGAGTKAVAAWVAAVNQTGGVNGHPVQYLVADDGADPGRHQALVREMVEQRHVVAFVYQLAPLSGSSSVKYLEQKRVPVVGSEAASPWFDTSPVFFEQSTQGSLAAVPMLGAAAFYGAGKTKVGIIVCAEGVAICEDAKRTMPEWDVKFGLEVVQVQTASMAQPDYTAECLALKNAGAEMMAFIGDANSLIRLARSCANAGVRPQFFFAQQQSQNQFLSEPLLEGAAGDALTAPWFLSSSAAVAEFQAALKRYAPGTAPDGQTSFGWAAAKLFERAATSVSGPVTSETLLEALGSLRDETLGGFTMPLTFQPGQPNPQKVCFNPIRIEKGRFTSAENGAFRCVS